MLVVGGIGLLVNMGAAAVLHRSVKENLNVEGAFLHVISDVLGSIAVIGAGVLILSTGWVLGDPIFGGIIGVLIVISFGRLLWKVLHVLMGGTPTHLDLHGLRQRLEQLDGITGVDDIHAWSITTGYDALSAHVTADMSTLSSQGQVLDGCGTSYPRRLASHT